MVDHGESRQQAAPQTPAKNKQNRGPRSLWIDRWENGFGFTLRHFIVYPPESYSVMAGERGLGLRHGNPNEPMDTIFVKNVHEGTSAQAAGLATGDRILSVNGETIAGKSYAKVVQQIQNTPGKLHLLVVPKEDDIIQQYFSDTAHCPKTNPRPRLKSPEITGGEHRRSSTVPTPSSQRIVTPQKLAKTSIKQPVGVLQQRVPFMESEPIYNQLMWPENQKIGSENRGTMERHRLKTPLSRRLSDGSSSSNSNSLHHQPQESTLSVIKPIGTATTPPVYYPNSSGCRLSLDGGMLDRRESSSSSTLTDDSLIISRIRKSCEQKEEFLRNTVVPTYSPIIAREFYARPQKLQKPVWPPQSPEPDPSEQRPKSTPNDERQSLSVGVGKPFPRTLTRIQENLPHNFGSSSLDSDTDEVPQSSHESLVSRSLSEESESIRRGVTQPKLHLVSRRAKQFETGQLEEEDRTHFYRSELARLSGKKVVPNVADRKQEFEQRVGREERQSFNRETRSLETCSPPPLGNSLSGNRTVIVGSKNLHCEPPLEFKQLTSDISDEPAFKTRARSNSAESWSSRDNDHSTRRSLHGVSVDRAKDKEKQRHKAVRQDSYLAAVKTIPGNVRPRRIIKRQMSNHISDESSGDEIISQKAAVPLREAVKRPNRLNLHVINDGNTVPAQTVPITTTADVVRRQRNGTSLSAEDERATRRVSYLKATSNDRMNVDTDGDSSASTQKSGDSPPRRHLIDNLRPEAKENFKLIKDGWLNCKVALIDGKRAGDRSWKQIWAILRGPLFSMQKDKNSEQTEQTVDVRSCSVDVPQDYTKKKNVLRLKTETETEYLLQAEDTGDMEQWKKVLEEQSESGNTLSPQPTHKGIKKLSNLRTRSPTGQSPASKTRKPSQQDQIPSPKSKTWKGKLGKQFRRMQGSGSPSSPTTPYPEGATIGVPLETCPPSTISELIPLIVERCTSIVEARGLEIVGIYRVPGNTAAVTALTEAVNKGVELMHPEDPRWNDVNVISSLLKSFFRNLPDSLFTSELYPKFIAADKIPDQKLRMITLRKLVNELPDHNYETLKHLLYHLKKVVSNSSVNKMETRNLAIVFGPTLLTTGDLITLVTDTSHQCRIVESLISHVDWFFSSDDVDALDNMSLPMSTDNSNSDNSGNASLLLGNIHKVEGYSRGDHSPSKEISPKDLVSSILSAANRKMSKGKSKKLEKASINIDTKSTVKKEVKQETEQTTSTASTTVNSFVSEIVRTNGDDTDSSTNNTMSHDEVIRSYSGLNEQTSERIRRFRQETEAMLQRYPVRNRRDAEKLQLEKQSIEMKLQQAKRELENEDLLDALADNPSDLTKKANLSQISSQSEDGNVVRRGTSYESLNNETITPNGSLKRFKSSREDSGLRTATSLDSLQDRPKSELSDDGNDLVVSLVKTFDKKLKSFLNESSSSSLGDENKSATEKAEIENVVEKESKLLQKEEKKIAPEEENNNNHNNSNNNTNANNEEKAKSEESKKSKVKIDPKIKEKLKKFEISDSILRTKNTENVTNLKRSESLNKPEKPEVNMKLRRSESLNKNERSNDFSKLKRSDSSKNDLKRSDSLTKNEKTETNINKRKQEAGLKRSSSKEKENMLVKLKRKNGMPDRSIKRRHTVGGTKDFDKLPWLDNRLQTEAQENEESIRGKEKRNLRTSSPDLSSSRLKSAIESEGLSIEVSLLGSRGNVLATLRQHLIAPSSPGRPQSMPPVSQLFKLPLESHV